MPDARIARRRACLLVALVSTALVFVWTAARVHYVFDGNWTALFCTGATFPLPPELEAGTYRFPGDGYDGQFYRLLAHDPFLQKGYSRYADMPQTRFRRLLIPLSAWLIGVGQRGPTDAAYIAIEMLFIGLGAYWCARLLERRGRSPLWGFLFVVVPATLTSFDRMLLDGPIAALFAGFVLYCDEENWTRAWIVATVAAFTRDTGLLLIAGLVVDRLLRRDWGRAVWFASGGIPAVGWYLYVASRLPFDPPSAQAGIPIWGFLRRLLWLRPDPNPAVQLLVRITDAAAVIGLAVSIVLAIRWMREERVGPVTLCMGLFVALSLVLCSPSHMIEAMGYARPISPMLLWVMLEAISRKTWSALAPPLLVSLSISLAFGRPLIQIVNGLLGR